MNTDVESVRSVLIRVPFCEASLRIGSKAEDKAAEGVLSYTPGGDRGEESTEGVRYLPGFLRELCGLSGRPGSIQFSELTYEIEHRALDPRGGL